MLINQNNYEYFKIDEFQNMDDVNNIISNSNEQPYCFVINIKKFDTDLDEYDF